MIHWHGVPHSSRRGTQSKYNLLEDKRMSGIASLHPPDHVPRRAYGRRFLLK
jgi:hypothetical protein